MESLMINKTISDTDYSEYIDGIINIFRLSSSDKYIIFGMKIENNQCSAKMTIYNQEGVSKEFQDVTINCDEHFYESLLKKMVQKLEEVCIVTKKDVVNLDGDEYVAFRMITSHNDLFTIDGLTKEQADVLLKNDSEVGSNTIIHNRSGHSSFIQLLFMISFLFVSFVMIVLLVD